MIYSQQVVFGITFALYIVFISSYRTGNVRFTLSAINKLSKINSEHNSRVLGKSRNYYVTALELAGKDLFADDLFDDEDNSKPIKKEAPAKEEDPMKQKYLDQKWKLTAEDAKDFKGFPKKDEVTERVQIPTSEPAEKVPCFALMYKFRREYLETGVEATMADHKGHCAKFKRLLNSELINLGKAKGVVLLWAGFTEGDKAETRADIMAFLEEDPLIVKDVVENWDIISLSPETDDVPAAELPK